MPRAPSRTRPAAASAALAAALCAALPAQAGAAAPPSWTAEADAIAAQWPGLQNEDGSFRDYILSRDPTDLRDDYGDPKLGYALLLTAARNGDAALATAGLRALERSLGITARNASTLLFYNLAVAGAYNVARASFEGHPVFQRMRAGWEDYLRAIEPYRLLRPRITNKTIVEAVVLLEVARSGLTDAASDVALVKRFLRTDLPRVAKPFERGGRAILGDMPELPPAYHGLSVGMLGRALELLGAQAPSAARALLVRAARASVAATAPDGDVALHGRSQLNAWTLSLTAYGAELAARDPAGAAEAPLHLDLAARTIERLIAAYDTGSEGFLFTPALAQGIRAAIPGLDEYVSGTSYVGLTLATLEWAIEAAPDGPMRDDGAERPGAAFVHGSGPGAWASAQGSDLWYEVRRTRTSPDDLRYDFGLVALKLRGADGRWRDVLPPRPRTVAQDDSAGPVLTTAGGSTGYPEATSLSVRDDGRIVARGGFRAASGRWLRRGVEFRFAPTDCGVRLTLPVARGDRFAYSAFFAGTPQRTSRSVADADQVVTLGRAASSSVSGGYSSGAHARLKRVRLRFPRAAAAGSLSITTCER